MSVATWTMSCWILNSIVGLAIVIYDVSWYVKKVVFDLGHRCWSCYVSTMLHGFIFLVLNHNLERCQCKFVRHAYCRFPLRLLYPVHKPHGTRSRIQRRAEHGRVCCSLIIQDLGG